MARRYHFETRVEPEHRVDGPAKHHPDASSEPLCGQHPLATPAASMPLGLPHESSRSQVVPSPRQNFLLAVLAEFGRAMAAAQRYEDLRYRSASRGSIAAGDIPRRVFEEFYSSGKAAESRRPQVASVRFAGRAMQPGKGVVVD